MENMKSKIMFYITCQHTSPGNFHTAGLINIMSVSLLIFFQGTIFYLEIQEKQIEQLTCKEVIVGGQFSVSLNCFQFVAQLSG